MPYTPGDLLHSRKPGNSFQCQQKCGDLLSREADPEKRSTWIVFHTEKRGNIMEEIAPEIT